MKVEKNLVDIYRTMRELAESKLEKKQNVENNFHSIVYTCHYSVNIYKLRRNFFI